MTTLLVDLHRRIGQISARISNALAQELPDPEDNDGTTRHAIRALLDGNATEDDRDHMRNVLAQKVLNVDGTALRWLTDEIDVTVD